MCSDSRDRKKSCYNTIDGQITRPICSKDKVPVLIAIGSEGYELIKVLLVTSDLIVNSVLMVQSLIHNISSHKILCDFT